MPGTNEAFSNGELASVDSRARFVEKAADELKRLHEGNIARYRLRLSEFRDWKAKQQHYSEQTKTASGDRKSPDSTDRVVKPKK